MKKCSSSCVLVPDYDAKSPSAVDYSDIREAAEDETSVDVGKSLATSLEEQRHGMSYCVQDGFWPADRL